MYPHSVVDQNAALKTARYLADASQSDCARMFGELLRHKELSHTVHHLNLMLASDEYAGLAREALGRLGFDTSSH